MSQCYFEHKCYFELKANNFATPADKETVKNIFLNAVDSKNFDKNRAFMLLYDTYTTNETETSFDLAGYCKGSVFSTMYIADDLMRFADNYVTAGMIAEHYGCSIEAYSHNDSEYWEEHLFFRKGLPVDYMQVRFEEYCLCNDYFYFLYCTPQADREKIGITSQKDWERETAKGKNVVTKGGLGVWDWKSGLGVWDWEIDKLNSTAA